MIMLCFALTCCAAQPTTPGGETGPPRQIRYLALGDSYTIGESVDPSRRWPDQLVTSLRQQGLSAADPVIIAKTGWTTGELEAAIGQQNPDGPFELVSLQIGVNNQYRGYDVQEYRTQFQALLQQAIAFAGGDADRVIVLSIPDWGVTPFASRRDRNQIASEIDQFNTVNRTEAQQAGARYVDVTPISRQAAMDPSLVAEDGLHPSGKMYEAWVSLVLPEALSAVGSSAR
jgi:lysophospholipase L1-like esterase